jgi:Tol biopolymer transport system component
MRRRPTWSLLVLLSACKAQISGAPADLGAVDAATDAADDLPIVDAPGSQLGPWSTPVKVTPAATTTLVEDDVTLSSNTLELFFAVAGTNGKDLYYTSRSSTTAAWTPAVALPFNSAAQSDETPRLSADDKTLYFASGRGGNGTLDIYAVTRPAAGSTAWGTPLALSAVNTTTQSEKWFMPCGTDRYVMVQSRTKDDSDLVEGTLGGGPPTPLTALNSLANETGTFVSPDCLTIYFASARVAPLQIYRSQRASLTAPWQPPTPVVDLVIAGGNGNQEDPWLSADGRTFAFASDAAGTKDVYLSTR